LFQGISAKGEDAMAQVNDANPELNAFKEAKRKVIKISAEELVTTGSLNHGRHLPHVIRPQADHLDLPEWAENNLAYIETVLAKHGAILFRGFNLKSVPEFERFVRAVSGEILAYNERSSPRSQISGQIYTSTDYPAEKYIFLHNEQSYNLVFPMKIFFYCVRPPAGGGATPIADTRRVFERIACEIRERFMERKYLYVRNFGDGFGLSWQAAFQTRWRTGVQEYCRNNQIECEWKAGNRLRTKQVREVAIRHPKTGEWTWFNHLTFFHYSTLDRKVQAEMLSAFAEEDLPNNTYYGDGCRIEAEVMEHLREAYQKEMVRFDWEKGDVLMLDNMLAAHGREPYIGERSVAVGMAEPWGWNKSQVGDEESNNG
jgi:alpha-ketoglutarate-dependent taurine dioxygenase